MTGTSKLLLSVLSPLVLLLQQTHDRPLVRIGEMSMDISPYGVTTNTCVLVQPDGHVHLEVRVQRLPTPTATLHIYEANLDDFQMLRLHNLLDVPGLRDAGDFQLPKLPLTAPAFKVATVQITREHHIQKLGYLAWNERGDKKKERPESEPEAVKEQWQRSRVMLTPLLQWSHELQLIKMSELPESVSTLCHGDSSPE
jgi:hypothetical protein